MCAKRHDRLHWTRYGPALLLALLGGCQGVAPTAGALARAAAAQPESRPGPVRVAKFGPPVVAMPPSNVVPIGLDTVLRFAQDRNGQIQLARSRLDEAAVGEELARKAWLPQVYVGPTYYRHEGGIPDFFGNLLHSSYGTLFGGMEVHGRLDPRDIAFQHVDAARQVWQQKGELSKLTSENLLDAASTYVDLLAARSSEGLAIEIEKQLTDLLEQANSLAKLDPGMRVEAERVETDLRSHRVILRKLREGGDAAAAKLIYLLGMDPASVLVPIEKHLVPLTLVDAQQPVDGLVEQALRQGPGVRELEGLLRLIDETRAAAEGPSRLLPALEVTMNEGAIGSGPGADVVRQSVQHRHEPALEPDRGAHREGTAAAGRPQGGAGTIELSGFAGPADPGRDRGAGAILSGQDQLPLAEDQVRHAERSYALSASRLKESIKGRSPSEVLQAIRGLGAARLQVIQTVRDLDKAQLRLLLLVGNGS